MNKKILFWGAAFALALLSETYCMDGILTSYELPNATVEQFESLLQADEGICGACAIANAVAIDDILRDFPSHVLTPINVQEQAMFYQETINNAYYYGLATHPGGGMTGHETLTYALSHGLKNVYYMLRDLTIHDMNGIVDANELQSLIYHLQSARVYFLCDVRVQGDLHTVLAVLIKEPRHRTRIIYMDANNILLDNYPTVQAQISFISFFA